MYNQGFNFVKAPMEFNKSTERDTLQYCLGATLYMPGTKDIREKVINHELPVTSFVMCCEDAIKEEDLPAAEQNILDTMDYFADQIEAGTVNRDELVRNITPERVAAVKEILLQAKKQICGWEVDFGKEEMTKGKAWLNLSWSGDAQFAIEEAGEMGVMLDYIVPKEGSNVWFDGWVIPKYAKNVKAATYFIDYMCKAENALKNMDEIGYVSCAGGPNAAAEILEEVNDDEEWPETVDASYFFGDEPIEVDGEMLDPHALHLNPVYYADKSTIDRCALMHDAGESQEMLLEMWNEIKLAR